MIPEIKQLRHSPGADREAILNRVASLVFKVDANDTRGDRNNITDVQTASPLCPDTGDRFCGLCLLSVRAASPHNATGTADGAQRNYVKAAHVPIARELARPECIRLVSTEISSGLHTHTYPIWAATAR